MTREEFISGLQNQNLKIPKKHHESVQQFTMTKQPIGNREKNRDYIPFIHYVDIWWLALCIGVQDGKKSVLDSNKWHTFVRAGEALPSTPWRISHLQLIAIGESDDTNILTKPSAIITMANEYAATGLPLLIDNLSTLGGTPIWEITQFIENRITSQ